MLITLNTRTPPTQIEDRLQTGPSEPEVPEQSDVELFEAVRLEVRRRLNHVRDGHRAGTARQRAAQG